MYIINKCSRYSQRPTTQRHIHTQKQNCTHCTPTAIALAPTPNTDNNRWLRPVGPILNAGSVWLLSPTASYFDGWKPAESLFSNVSFPVASFRVSVISQYCKYK